MSSIIAYVENLSKFTIKLYDIRNYTHFTKLFFNEKNNNAINVLRMRYRHNTILFYIFHIHKPYREFNSNLIIGICLFENKIEKNATTLSYLLYVGANVRANSSIDLRVGNEIIVIG